MNMQNQRLTGKVALVTGASKGIGAGIARQLAAEGAAVAVNYSTSKAGAEKVVTEIKARGGKALAVQASLARPSDIGRLVAETREAFGPVDILVNNAGVYEFAPIGQITEEHFRKHFDLNVLGLLLATQETLKHFHPAGGSIINISSLLSTFALPNASVYSGTKGAVDAITRSLAAELGPKRIRVNALRPGMVNTEGARASGIENSGMQEQVRAQTPLGRLGEPMDIAGAAVFLASADSSWITGETFVIAGGLR